MTAAGLVWIAALALAAAALAWMLLLIVVRVGRDRAAARRAADRRRIEAALVDLLLGRGDVDAALEPYRGRARLLAETLLEFLALVRGGDRQLVLAAYERLGADDDFRARLTRGSAAGRLCCVEALGAFPGPEAERALRQAAAHGSPRLRLAALISLAEAGAAPPLAEVVDRLSTDRLQLSAVAAEFLRSQAAADPRASLAALEALAPAPAVRALIVDGLGAGGDYAALPRLVDEAENPEREVRAAAVRALGRLMHPAAEPCLARALDDTAWDVRSAAAEAIGAAGFARLAPALVGRLHDPVWRARFKAAAALVELGPVGQDILRGVVADGREPARSAAGFALAEKRLA